MIARLPIAPESGASSASLRAELGRLIDQHGLARIAAALLAVAARPRRTVGPSDLSPHLRRDLGLPPAPSRHDYWRHL